MQILKKALLLFLCGAACFGISGSVLGITEVPSATTSAAITVTPTITPTTTPTGTPTITVTPTPTPTGSPSSASAVLKKVAIITTTIPTPSLTPTPTRRPYPWKIRSISSMNMSKDKVCNQLSDLQIAQWVQHAKGLGTTHIGLETPYDNPACGSSIVYTQRWINAIRAAGLHVWHRHMFLQFENIYGAGKVRYLNWPKMIGDYIRANPSFFQNGDVFTPLAEPSNAGVYGWTWCPDFCMFSGKADFNNVMRASITESKNAFKQIGRRNITMAGVNLDGFALDGLYNPDHQGKDSLLESSTIKMAGMIALDHYPPPGHSMEADLKTIRKTFPKLQLVIGEWGPIYGGNTAQIIAQTFKAFKSDKHLMGVQYWQMGPAGYEGLLDNFTTSNANYTAVQTGFSR